MGRLLNAAGVAVAVCATGVANADLIDFEEGFVHGQIVNTQLASGMGVTISADNPNKSFDLAIIFDTLQTGTADVDLQGPPWAGGNLFLTQPIMGNILIVAENNGDSNNDGLIDSPDDEQLAGGRVMFEFDTSITAFGFDIIDVEGTLEENATIDFLSNGELVGRIMLSDFVTIGSEIYDPTIDFGNNTANRLAPIAASFFGEASFDEVHVIFAGSGGIDNIFFTPVPAPGVLAAMVMFAMCSRRRRS